jgi:hypothetical protein
MSDSTTDLDEILAMYRKADENIKCLERFRASQPFSESRFNQSLDSALMNQRIVRLNLRDVLNGAGYSAKDLE